MRNFWLLAMAALISGQAFASPVQGPGVEVRQYLVGTIPELVGRIAMSPQLEFDFGAGADIAYHGNQGVQDHESGVGYGVSLGARAYYFGPVFLGVRTDLWRESINWTNQTNPNLSGSGTSRFWIVQPTAEIGSNFRLGSWWVSPALGIGAEINTFVDGAPTGQGLILLLGITLVWQSH